MEEYYFALIERLNFLEVHGHVTVDNGSNNSTLFAQFGRRPQVNFRLDQMMHRCLAHVLNLVARDGIAAFGGPDQEAVEEEQDQRMAVAEDPMKYDTMNQLFTFIF